MDDHIHFETPENVRIRYQPAGLGTRFVGWLIDYILVMLLSLILVVLLLFAGAAAGWAIDEAVESFGDRMSRAQAGDQDAAQEVVMISLGIGMLVWGLGSFFYFGLSELLMRGQTLGKRLVEIRVVKTNGFSLDASSIFVRNVFRVADQLPPLWLTPLLSKRSQRFGDMVAGTVVVAEAAEPIPLVRQELSERPAAETRYRFDQAALKRLRPIDWIAIERLLDRWDDLPRRRLQYLLDTMVPPLSRRLRVDPPPEEDRLPFLEDLLSAEYRRQTRGLG